MKHHDIRLQPAKYVVNRTSRSCTCWDMRTFSDCYWDTSILTGSLGHVGAGLSNTEICILWLLPEGILWLLQTLNAFIGLYFRLFVRGTVKKFNKPQYLFSCVSIYRYTREYRALTAIHRNSLIVMLFVNKSLLNENNEQVAACVVLTSLYPYIHHGIYAILPCWTL